MTLLAKNSIFKGLTPTQHKRLLDSATLLKMKKNTVFIQEGAKEKTFYYILEGKVTVYRHQDSHDHVLTTLGKGETVGELALIDNAPRSTTVKCLKDCTVYQFDINQLNTDPGLIDVVQILTLNIGQQLSKRLRSTNEVALAALKNKFAMSIFSIRMLILMSLYALFLNLIERSKDYLPNTTFLSLVLIIIFSMVVLSIIRQSGYPIKFYGFTLDHLLKNTVEGVLFSLPIMAFVVLLKWFAITYIVNLNTFPLFDPSAIFNQGVAYNAQVYLISVLMYAAFCPLQEFMVRGCVQTSLQTLLEGSEALVKWKAIIISNLIFASAHSHTSLGFALSVFIPGLFWGWLFYRQKSLVGVSISHILIGVWAVFIVGFENII